MKSEERPVTSWQASKLGGCLSGVYLERLGVKPLVPFEPRTLRVFEVGKMVEEYLVKKVEESGVKYETQVRVDNAEHGATGYADLVIEDENGDKEVVEIKSVHSRSFWYMVGNSRKSGEGPYMHHKIQLMLYMLTLGIKRGRLVYVSKDDMTIQEYELSIDDEVVKRELLKNLNILNKALQDKKMPFAAAEGSFQAKYCRYHDYCTGKLPIPQV